MDLAWLEDFVEVVATRNFSVAAAARNISQPAFSRRIKALEAWLGADLVDRSTSPVRLTATGNALAPRCQELVDDIYGLRVECQKNATPDRLKLSFAALHSIEMFFFPAWLIGLRERLGDVQSHMHGGDFLDCIESLSLGNCDFAIMYNAPDGPPVLGTGPFKSLIVGYDELIPVSGCDVDGNAFFDVSQTGSQAIPFLAYSWKDGYLGKLITLLQRRRKEPINLEIVYQSSLAEGIKRMAIAGLGIAWLPLSTTQGAIGRRQLVQIGGPSLAIGMEVRLYRRNGPMSAAAETVWSTLGGEKG